MPGLLALALVSPPFSAAPRPPSFSLRSTQQDMRAEIQDERHFSWGPGPWRPFLISSLRATCRGNGHFCIPWGSGLQPMMGFEILEPMTRKTEPKRDAVPIASEDPHPPAILPLLHFRHLRGRGLWCRLCPLPPARAHLKLKAIASPSLSPSSC